MGRFFVGFPPHKKVTDIKKHPFFNLRKEGVRVEVLEWIGELDPLEELQNVCRSRAFPLDGVIGKSLLK